MSRMLVSTLGIALIFTTTSLSVAQTVNDTSVVKRNSIGQFGPPDGVCKTRLKVRARPIDGRWVYDGLNREWVCKPLAFFRGQELDRAVIERK